MRNPERKKWMVVLGISAVTGYLVFVVSSHYWISEIYGRIFHHFGRVRMEWGLGWISVMAGTAIAAGGLGFLLRQRRPGQRELLLWLVAAAMSVAADRLLISTNIERIHFPQYAVLAVLLCLMIRDDFLVVFLGTLAGAMDELVQFVWKPQYTRYLDFNDMVLNLLGALLGVLLYRAFSRKAPFGTMPAGRFRKGAYLLSGLLLLAALAAAAGGRVKERIPLAEPVRAIVSIEGKRVLALSFLEKGGFWSRTDFGRRYHVLTPLEGLLVLGAGLCVLRVVFTGSGGMDRKREGVKGGRAEGKRGGE